MQFGTALYVCCNALAGVGELIYFLLVWHQHSRNERDTDAMMTVAVGAHEHSRLGSGKYAVLRAVPQIIRDD